MMRAASRVLRAVAGACVLAGTVGAQDSVVVRHLFALDVSRLAPFRRSYEMVVHRPDSSFVIGVRDVELLQAERAGTMGWLLVERRTGTVAATESLFVAADARPVHRSSWLGSARLAAAFVGDTILGATQVGLAKQNLLIAGRPDLLVSGAMVELLLGLLPLEDQWTDSAAVLSVTASGRRIIPVELMTLGREELQVDSLTSARTSVVALRSEERSILYWVEVATGAVLRMQQLVPGHVGSVLEYRFLPIPAFPNP